jgi:hypothetical protein
MSRKKQARARAVKVMHAIPESNDDSELDLEALLVVGVLLLAVVLLFVLVD